MVFKCCKRMALFDLILFVLGSLSVETVDKRGSAGMTSIPLLNLIMSMSVVCCAALYNC